MTSWDDLDSFKLTLQPTFQAPSNLNPAWQGGFQHAHQIFTPPTQSTLSLDRYLQLLQLLCGGQPATARNTPATQNTWTVRQLGELERAAVKMEDLRKVLALNGRAISAKNKQDMLNKIVGLQLACPVFSSSSSSLFPTTAPPNKYENTLLEAEQKQKLQQSMHKALEWADISPSEATVATAAISRQGCYSFCPLPEITLPYSSLTPFSEEQEHAPPLHQQQRQQQQQPATSETTFASRPALQNAQIVDSCFLPSSPSSPQAAPGTFGGGNYATAGFVVEDTIMHDAVNQQNFSLHPSPPEWLIPGYQKIAAVCQGVKNPPRPLVSNDLKGRKIAFVMNEEFQQGGDEDDGIIDIVARGIHLGQIVEWIGNHHDEEICGDDCPQQNHNFCYVRVTPTETTAPKHKPGRRRLDLHMDLREVDRVETVEDFLLVGEKELVHAWILVEPKDSEED